MRYAPDFLARLGLDGGADQRAIRRAYARLLKQIDQETQAGHFQQLREDYEAALAWSAWQDDAGEPGVDPGGDPGADGRSPAIRATAQQSPRLHHEVPPAPIDYPVSFNGNGTALHDAIVGADAEQLADEMFQQFLEAISAPRAAGLAYKAALAALQQCIDDERLLNFAARDGFELSVAAFLSAGYHRDHEVLFNAAQQVFDWTADRYRLGQLGYAGDVLKRALDERAMFNAQNTIDRNAQRQVLQALRKPEVPEARDLHGRMPHLRTLLTRFPVLMSLIADEQVLKRWDEAYVLIEGKPTVSNATFAWIFGLLCLIFLFFNAVKSSTFDYPSPRDAKEQSIEEEAPAAELTEPADPYDSEPVKRAQIDEIASHFTYQIGNGERPDIRSVGYAVHLDEAGWIKSLSILKSSGNKRYDDAIRKAIWASTPFASSTGRDFHLVFAMRIVPEVSSDAFGFTTVPALAMAKALSSMQPIEGTYSRPLPAPPIPTMMRAPSPPPL